MENENANNIIKEEKIPFEKECSFNKIKNLQLLIKKEHFLKEQCKYF